MVPMRGLCKLLLHMQQKFVVTDRFMVRMRDCEVVEAFPGAP